VFYWCRVTIEVLAEGQDPSNERVVQVAKVDVEKQGKTAEAKAPAKAKPEVKLTPCGCGCGTMVPRRFAMGHDARLKGTLTRVIYWTKATAELPKRPTEAQIAKSVARMEAEGWTYKLDQKRMEQSARMRNGEVAGLKGDKVETKSGAVADSVLKPKGKVKDPVPAAKKPAAKPAAEPKPETIGARTFSADDDIEEID